jgi:hypothetical protein
MEARVIRIEGIFEVWGFFQNGVLVREQKVRIPFSHR